MIPTATAVAPLDRRHFLALLGAGGLLVSGCTAARTDTGNARTTTVDTVLGAVDVPVSPTAVVALYANDVDVALVLGLPLVGASTANGAGAPEGFAAHQPADELDGVVALQTYPEVDYEALAAVDPDLVVSSLLPDPDRDPRLAAIAPTLNYSDVLFGADGSASDWRAALRFVAEPLGRSAAAEAHIGDVDARARALADRLAGTDVGTVAVLTPYDGQLYVQTSPALFMSTILVQDLGLPLADVTTRLRAETGEDEVVLSAERFSDVDADTLVVLVYPDEDGGELAASGQLAGVTSSPLWRGLPAVAAGRVVLLPSELNFPSPLTVDAVLSRLDDAL